MTRLMDLNGTGSNNRLSKLENNENYLDYGNTLDRQNSACMKTCFQNKKGRRWQAKLMAPQCSLGATAILLSPQLSYIALIFWCCVLLGWFQTRHADTRMGHNASISYFISVTQNPLMQNHRYRGRKRKNSRRSKSTDMIKLALITLTCTNQCTYSLPHAYCATQMNYTSCSIEPTMLQHNS